VVLQSVPRLEETTLKHHSSNRCIGPAAAASSNASFTTANSDCSVSTISSKSHGSVRLGESRVDTPWEEAPLELLHYYCTNVSPNRPPYTAHVEDTEARKSPKKTLKPKANTEGKASLSTDDAGRVKHARKERIRREAHRVTLMDSYHNVSDKSLELAGWDLNSVKAPTKETIMLAAQIDRKLRERWIQLLRLDSAAKDKRLSEVECENERLRHEIQMCRERENIPNSSTGERVPALWSHQLGQDHLSSQSIEPPCQNQPAPRWGQSSRKRGNGSIGSTSPTNSTWSLLGSYSSAASAPMKRKREEEDNITPTGPLRYGMAKSSLNSSPRSATF
jgi:hypothetical protein